MFGFKKEKVKILIVEDEAIVAKDIKNSLERLKYDIMGVLDSGDDVINLLKIKGKIPDLILMDIKLKGKMDGIETVSKIKEYDIPVIYLTAYSDKDTIERAKATIPYGFLIKPFDPAELNSVIQMAVYKYNVEKELKESKERYKYLIDHIEEFVLIINDKAVIEFANRSALNILQRKIEDVVGKSVSDFLTEDSASKSLMALKNEFSGKSTEVAEVEVVNSSGEIRNLKLAKGSRFFKEKGKIVGLLVSGQDITEQKKIEEELKIKNKDLESANKIMIGRELKMIELKKHIKELEEQLKNK